MNDLLQMRLDLDEAITYGEILQAKSIALRGFKRAQRENLLGETEYFQGQLALLKESYEEALRHFDQAIAHNPSDGAPYNDKALCLIELGFIDQALDCLDKGIKVEPDFATIHHNKGWLLNKLGHYSAALICFRKALMLDPQRAVTYENIADAHEQMGDFNAALDALYKSVKVLKPEYSQIRKELEGQIHQIQSRLTNKV